MVYSETDTKINTIVDFLRGNKEAEYSIKLSSSLSENSITVSVFSYGEMLNIVTNVNLQVRYPFFKFDDFVELSVELEKPIHLQIQSLN